MVLDIITLSAIVVASTEVLKRAIRVPTNWQPALAVALALAFGGTTDFWGWASVTMGEALLAGLSAGGLYDWKNPVKAIFIKKTIKPE